MKDPLINFKRSKRENYGETIGEDQRTDPKQGQTQVQLIYTTEAVGHDVPN